MGSRLWALAFGLCMLGAGSWRLEARQAVTLETVLDRLGAYLTDYADRLPSTIASEHYVQTARNGSRNDQAILDSDFGIVLLPGVKTWLGFRQVLKVNGKEIPHDSLESLFVQPGTDSTPAWAAARRVSEASAKYNIGPILRTVNNPALVLEILDARNRPGMRFSKDRETDVDGTNVWVIQFAERQRPTIVRAAGNADAPSRGRAWVDPSNGTLLRAEVQLEGPLSYRSRFSGDLTVVFQRDAKLQFWVPARLMEAYRYGSGRVAESGEAVYSDYRRFSVTTRIVPTPEP